MSNFKQDIIAAAAGEPIEAIVFGADDYGHRFQDNAEHFNKVLSWDVAAPMLDYDYDTGFGGADCHAITAWTPNRVIFVSTYDGATEVIAVPRNPAPHVPRMTGGG